MGIATFTEDKEMIKREFGKMADFFKKVKSAYFEEDDSFRELSIGMSNDYEIAIETGSTMVRIGSLIFGER